jgi:hypothetical protein
MSNTIFMSRVECKKCLVAIAVLQHFRIDAEDTDCICPKRCSKRVLKEEEKSENE